MKTSNSAGESRLLGLGLILCGAAWAAADAPVTDTYHGVTVTDPYRWLENANDPAVQSWSAAHDRRARAYLDALPYRKAIYERLYQQLSASSASYYSIAVAGGRLFALSNQPPKNQPMLVMLGKDADPTQARIVVDPNTLNAGGTTAIDWFVPSPDGRLLAVSMSENGSEDGSVHVFDADSGKQVYEVLPRVQYPTGGGSLAWRADSKGFWYTRYPGTERPEAERHFYMAVYYHELGQDPARDAYVFGKGLPKIAEIALDNRQNTHYVLATVQKGDGGEYAHYLIDRDSHVTQLTQFTDAVAAATVGPDDNIYLISQQQAPRGKLLVMPASAPVLAHARLLLPESEAVLQTRDRPIVVTSQAIYLREMLGGPGRVEILDHDGKRRGLLPLPDVATVDEVESVGDGTLLYSVETYLRPTYYLPLPRGHGQVGGDSARPDQPGEIRRRRGGARVRHLEGWHARAAQHRASPRHGAQRRQPGAAVWLRRLPHQRSALFPRPHGQAVARCRRYLRAQQPARRRASSARTGTPRARSRTSRTCSTISRRRLAISSSSTTPRPNTSPSWAAATAACSWARC